MSDALHVVGLSGGHDSTALSLRLAELNPATDYTFVCTPTGDELPPMVAHWERLECLLGKPLLRITNGTLDARIERYNALPNWRQRWCTRELKIVPMLAFLKANPGSTLYVGLRADEEERQGIYSDSVTTVFPLREWGWGEREVQRYLALRGVSVPERTDCATCYGQRIGEWERLFWQYPDRYAAAEEKERRTGHTYRSPQRDKWPAALAELRPIFAARGRQLAMFDDDGGAQSCRVCRL